MLRVFVTAGEKIINGGINKTEIRGKLIRLLNPLIAKLTLM
jgi:hypothetical protein